MIKPHVSSDSKCLILIDNAYPEWYKTNAVSLTSGMSKLTKMFIEHGVELNKLSCACLADTIDKPKSSDYKSKHEEICNLVDTLAPNLIVTIGGPAFERVCQKKGVSKYYKRPIKAELFGNYKCLPIPNIAAAEYNAEIIPTLIASMPIIKYEMGFPELIEAETIPKNYHVLDTISKFDKWLEYYKSDKVTAFSYDTETSSFDYLRGQLLMISFSHKEGFGYVLPSKFYNHWTESEWEYIKKGLIELFSDDRKLHITWNGKYDNHWLYHHVGIPIRRYNVYDGCLAAFTVDENNGVGLKEWAAKNTDLANYDDTLEEEKNKYAKEHKIKLKEFSYSYLDFSLLSFYAAADADATYRLKNVLQDRVKEEKQEEVLKYMHDFSWMLFWIEESGWKVDIEYCHKYHKELSDEIELLEVELAEDENVAKALRVLSKLELEKVNSKRKTKLIELKEPLKFNFKSLAHKKVLFLDILKLPVVKYVKNKNKKDKSKNPAIDKEVFVEWSKHHDVPILTKFTRYSEIVKARSTYVEAVLAKAVNGRVHANFNLINAKTGRLSCSGGINLQNISARGNEAKKIKRMFICDEDEVILARDLKAAEVRVGTLVSNDSSLIKIFNESGGFVHESVAKAVFNLDCAVEDVKELYPEERQISKAISFLLLYGGSATALANSTGITKERAEEIMEDYFNTYTGIAQWIKDTHTFVRQHGYSVSLLGRKRRVPGVFSDDNFTVERSLRMATNAVIQSFSADCLNIAAVNILEEIFERNLPFKIISSVHDCLYLSVPKTMVKEAEELMIKHMNSFPIPNAPISLDGDTEIGESWDKFTSIDKFDFEESDDETEDEDEEDIAA